ncbi:hypothetical protein [Olavius algarvensis spirochete endosymbiont]|uniref:hypothetical protein n=1 Tax=Olavius algarvensis spirochete endosymbiont TaxID=260710 RepID=UPI000F51ACD6|nr:hypothetical protein [Olavius algarvensis spirochete endosymbiont]
MNKKLLDAKKESPNKMAVIMLMISITLLVSIMSVEKPVYSDSIDIKELKALASSVFPQFTEHTYLRTISEDEYLWLTEYIVMGSQRLQRVYIEWTSSGENFEIIDSGIIK